MAFYPVARQLSEGTLTGTGGSARKEVSPSKAESAITGVLTRTGESAWMESILYEHYLRDDSMLASMGLSVIS